MENPNGTKNTVHCELKGVHHLQIGLTICELQQVKITPALESWKTVMHTNSDTIALIGIKLTVVIGA